MSAMSATLLDLAQRLDRLDPETDWEQRLALAEQLERQLGDRTKDFERRYEAVLARPVETMLRDMGLLDPPTPKTSVGLTNQAALPEPEPEPAPEPAPAPPPLTEEQRLQQAASAYRAWRMMALQSQVSEDEIKSASAAWLAERDAIEEGSPAWTKLQQAIEQIDAEIAAERARPTLYPYQLPGALPVPEAKK